MIQGVASKNCEAIYLMCVSLFFFQTPFVSNMSVLPQNTRECTKWVSSTWPNTHFLYYSMNIFGCRDDSGAVMLPELWENKWDKGPIMGPLLQGRLQPRKKLLSVRHSMLITHFQSSNHRKLRMTLCSKLHWVTMSEDKTEKRQLWAQQTWNLIYFTRST